MEKKLVGFALAFISAIDVLVLNGNITMKGYVPFIYPLFLAAMFAAVTKIDRILTVKSGRG